MSSPPRDEPAGDEHATRADATLSDRDRRVLRTVADVLRLGLRRPDLSDAQRTELYYTGRRWLSKDLAYGAEPATDAIFDWIDAVVPPEGTPAGEPDQSRSTGVLSLPTDDILHSPFDVESLSMVEPLRELADRRPDLSEAQCHELYRAARFHLTSHVRRRVVEPRPRIVFAWIDKVVSVRVPAQIDPGPADADLAVPSPTPHDPPPTAGQPSEHVEGPTPRQLMPPVRSTRQSLDGQDAGDPGAADLLARTVGRWPPHVVEHPEPIAPAPLRRARGLPDPKAAFERALVEAVNVRESRLSKTAIATRMDVDRKTLSRYINEGLIPPPPWESLAADLTGKARPQ